MFGKGNDAFASVTAGERFEAGKFRLEPYGGVTGTTATLKIFSARPGRRRTDVRRRGDS